MNPDLRSKGIVLVLAFLALSSPVEAQKTPKARAAGFRLFATAHATFAVNNVSCGLDADGEICDPGPYETLTGAAWPKGSPQTYIYNSGLQVAGTIQDTLGWAWAGDTTGAFFFDPKGTTQHGQQVEPIWNYTDADDRAHWPAAANVPLGDPSAALYGGALQGRPSASEGDVWTLAWHGDPAPNTGRHHRLGIS